ncbi:sensor domain-containing protein [Legionella bononiensis]|uniref:EAL domain-containing protein n=1 Tax=Legionella bononiensis TaxID=2793102 RepID=A0ABS1WFF9_9GAMM|nr:EAL domain-containing protein [Legionella bononiensis]MBL7481540.1 EAL domain-containing protein [Legionella bononiensis]MBL7528087.1 EAL domain-containing protein [Legionella bononiensis]MBL7562563.1 EAL domain-containing protein [Legionella bononiensis]
MMDKKRKTLLSIRSSHPKNQEDYLSTYKFERELISQLIENSHDELSLPDFAGQVLKVFIQHPLLKDKIIVLWQYDVHQSIRHLASQGLNFDIQKELRQASNKLAASSLLQIKTVRLRTQRSENLKKRIDICLEKTQQTFICISIWLDSTVPFLALMTPFLNDFLGICALTFSKILVKNREKLLNTILEKAGDIIEITNEEAVIEYVNPAFEKITLYNASEALNKTVASLLRSPIEDITLFEQIKTQLEAGAIWKGQIQSRKKDGTDWIAKTTIVPVVNEVGKVTQHIAIKQDITDQIKQINQLTISEERYRNLMNAASDAIFIHDLSGHFLETNHAACQSLGYSREEICNLYVWDIEVGVTYDVLSQMWKDLQDGPITLEGRHKRKDGTSFPVEVRLSIFNVTGEKLVLAIVRDITDRKCSENTIRKLTRALEQSPVLVMITDKSGVIEYVNAKVLEQTGYCADELLGQSSRILQSGKTPVEIYESMWNQLIKDEEWRGELLNKNKKGEDFWVSAIISPLRNDDEVTTHYLAVMEDVSQKKSYEELLKHQATYDHLTNLPNRAYGVNKLERAISKAYASRKKLAVLFLDLDDFKQINDSMGHAAGDLLLKDLSTRYLSVIRQTDTIARLGGDEFMLILENVNHISDAERIAIKCQEICLRPFKIESRDLVISSSIGIAIYPDQGIDAKTLMRNADTAMYQSKMKGKNNWTVFASAMTDMATHSIRIKAELPQVLARNELYICYQPIIDIKVNKVIAAEALLRWDSLSLGQITPEQIIPIAEETGLIIPLGYWILKNVCAQIKEWQLITGKSIKIAVNISTLQLKQIDFIEQLKLILNEAEVNPESLIFEITESAFNDDSKLIWSQLNQLNRMNIHCSLDDFGMSYSSLNYICSYPVKSLKIDRVFIQSLNTNNNDLNLVSSIIALSRKLKLMVIAEGIETEEQLDLIRSLNCDLVQGWYFSKEMTSDKFLSYLIDE